MQQVGYFGIIFVVLKTMLVILTEVDRKSGLDLFSGVGNLKMNECKPEFIYLEM